MKKIIALALAAGALIIPATASAMTTTQAKRMVQREVRFEYPEGYRRPEVTCYRLSSQNFNCRWETLTRADAAAGVDAHAGRGYVRGYDVRIITTNYGSDF